MHSSPNIEKMNPQFATTSGPQPDDNRHSDSWKRADNSKPKRKDYSPQRKLKLETRDNDISFSF